MNMKIGSETTNLRFFGNEVSSQELISIENFVSKKNMTELIYSYVENAIGKLITRISMEHDLLCLRNMGDDESDVSQFTNGLHWELGKMIDAKIITRE